MPFLRHPVPFGRILPTVFNDLEKFELSRHHFLQLPLFPVKVTEERAAVNKRFIPVCAGVQAFCWDAGDFSSTCCLTVLWNRIFMLVAGGYIQDLNFQVASTSSLIPFSHGRTDFQLVFQTSDLRERQYPPIQVQNHGFSINCVTTMVSFFIAIDCPVQNRATNPSLQI